MGQLLLLCRDWCFASEHCVVSPLIALPFFCVLVFGCDVLWSVLAIVPFLSAVLNMPVGPGFEGVHLHPLVIRMDSTTRIRTDRGRNEAEF